MSELFLPNISFEVTSVCNLRCAYCYNHWKRNGTNIHLNSYKRAFKTLKHLIKNVSIKQITFTGGEPFLGERFTELVLYSRIKNIDVSIITNGNAGKKEVYWDLVKMGVNLFQIPFLSLKNETHDRLTGVKGSWENADRSISEILKLGANVVPVVVLTKINYDDLYDTLATLHSKGLNRIMLNRFNIGGAGIGNADMVLNRNEVNTAFSIANELAETNKLIITSNVCSPICYINPSLFPNIRFGHCSPDITRRPITVNIDGDVRLCNHSPVVAGNIFHQTFEQIFNSEYARQWVDEKPDYCSLCDFYNKCRGGCKAASEQAGLGLQQPDPVIGMMFGQ